MSARIIDGKAIAAKVKGEVQAQAQQLSYRGIRPGLAVVIVGDDPGSHLYVRNKVRACAEAGVYSEKHELAATTTQAALLELIARLNAEVKIHGILVQLPLPIHIDTKLILRAIDPNKDIDGFHPENAGRLVEGAPRFVPCTPLGVMRLLTETDVVIPGRHAVIVGRSNIVGKPMAMLLLHADATVTICHSKSADLAAITARADILVVAVGKPRFVSGGMVKRGATVIDVGINRMSDGVLVGDVDFPAVQAVASNITPVPGGVGPMTIAMLLANTIRAAERSHRS